MTERNRSYLMTAMLGVALFLVNVYVCRELFRIEYLMHMGSIEGAFIGISRYAMTHFGDLKWFPLWIEGIPYSTTYPPLLHLVVAFLANLFHTSSAHSYHAVTALAYCLGPVALYALALRFSGSRWIAFAAGLIYSCVTFSAWLIPVIKGDLGGTIFGPRRLQAMVRYGEGPHVSSMTLLTLSLLFLDLAMDRSRKWRAGYFGLAAIFFAATAADNWLGCFATVLVVIPYAISRIGRNAVDGKRGWGWRDLARLGAIAAAAYCLAMPLVPPATIRTMVENAKTTGGDYAHAYQAALPQALGILVVLVLIKLAARKLSAGLQFAILFSFVMALVALADAYYQFAIVPMGLRYHLEMELAFALLIALAAQALLRNKARWISVAATIALVIALIYPLRMDRRYARTILLKPIDITSTAEWQMAQYFNHNWPGKEAGERVFMPGSVAFWFTAFADAPHLWGFEQAATDYVVRVADYEIYTGAGAGEHDAEYSILWLKAFGVHALGVCGPKSTEVYHNWIHPTRFDGQLPVLWRDGDNTIYQVGKHAPLARVVPRAALVNREPINGIDIEPIKPYVAALDDPAMPAAEFRWTSMHSMKISAGVREGQAISIQMAWAKGWHASVKPVPGKVETTLDPAGSTARATVPVLRDGIGLMYIDPGVSGRVDIEMYFDGGTELRLANVLSPLTAAVLLILSAWQFARIYFQRRVILKKS
jgi:hypothetical protein